MPEQKPILRAGVYRHYKGDHYLVIGVARDDAFEEDERLLVIYSRLYHRNGVPLCARPMDEFCGLVETENGSVLRFSYLGYADTDALENPVTTEAK
jgi:hypothetical protein